MPVRIYGAAGYTELQARSTAVANALLLPTSGTQLLSDAPTSGATSLAATFQNIGETFTAAALPATGTVLFDVLSQSVLYYTSNASATFVVNLRGNSSTTMNTVLATGQAVTCVFMVAQGASGASFYNTSVQVDGTTSGVTTRWQGGSAPTFGYASGIDVYTYTVLKTGVSTYTVLASLSQFA